MQLPAGTNGTGSIAGGRLGVYDAFISSLVSIGKGRSRSFLLPGPNIQRTGTKCQEWRLGSAWSQLTYTADFGQGITASFSAQDQVTSYQGGIWNVSAATPANAFGQYGANDTGSSRAPDLVAMLRVDQAWGLFQASVAAFDNPCGLLWGVRGNWISGR